jgi:hypothetical protein
VGERLKKLHSLIWIFIRSGDLPMKPDEIVVGGYYVMQEGGSIHHFYATDKYGKAWYRAYNMQNGEYVLTNRSSLEHLVWKAERRATAEEIGRLQEPKAEIEYQRSSLGKALRQTRDRRW